MVTYLPRNRPWRDQNRRVGNTSRRVDNYMLLPFLRQTSAETDCCCKKYIEKAALMLVICALRDPWIPVTGERPDAQQIPVRKTMEKTCKRLQLPHCWHALIVQAMVVESTHGKMWEVLLQVLILFQENGTTCSSFLNTLQVVVLWMGFFSVSIFYSTAHAWCSDAQSGFVHFGPFHIFSSLRDQDTRCWSVWFIVATVLKTHVW